MSADSTIVKRNVIVIVDNKALFSQFTRYRGDFGIARVKREIMFCFLLGVVLGLNLNVYDNFICLECSVVMVE